MKVHPAEVERWLELAEQERLPDVTRGTAVKAVPAPQQHPQQPIEQESEGGTTD